MSLRFSLTVMHADHEPKRREAMGRLLERLGQRPSDQPFSHIVTGKKTHDQRSKEAWTYHATIDSTHGVCLDDDAIPCPDFWQTLNAVVSARPNEIIALFSTHESFAFAHKEGLSWATSWDGLIGIGYVMPRGAYQALLAWREKFPNLETIHEDTLISLYAMYTGRRVFHTLPSLVDHDTTLESTWGNPHGAIKASAPPREGMAHFAWAEKKLAHVGRCYLGNHRMLVTEFDTDTLEKRKELIERYYRIEARPLVTQSPSVAETSPGTPPASSG